MSTAVNQAAEAASAGADWRGGEPPRAAAVSTEFIRFAIGNEQYGDFFYRKTGGSSLGCLPIAAH